MAEQKSATAPAVSEEDRLRGDILILKHMLTTTEGQLAAANRAHARAAADVAVRDQAIADFKAHLAKVYAALAPQPEPAAPAIPTENP